MKRLSKYEEMIPYLSDESRQSGSAQEICFPESAQEISKLLQEDPYTPVTTQGSRTGVTAGAVPKGGIAMNLSRMDRILTMPSDNPGGLQLSDNPGGLQLSDNPGGLQPSDQSGDIQASNQPGDLQATVQPGVLLVRLQNALKERGLFFPPDPTETTASIGGMVSCNSSGACSYKYGATREHILGLELVLSDGDILHIRRGEHYAKAGVFELKTDGGRMIQGRLPRIHMPDVRKHTAGYFIRQDMDMIDLLIGSEGTLGIVTRIDLSLLKLPKERLGVLVFFEEESQALRFVHLLRGEGETCRSAALSSKPLAIEFFGEDTLAMLRQTQSKGRAMTDLPMVPKGCAIYTELAADDRSDFTPVYRCVGEYIKEAGGDPNHSWVAFGGPDMQGLKDFRHAAPVCVNETISEIRKVHPGITKLGTDMSVPDSRLDEVFAMYRRDLKKEGFRSSLFGHIGNNHLHCNIIPADETEYDRGKELYSRWAEEIVSMGGSVSAEHGIGKLKPWLLQKLYSEAELNEMRELKRLFDPQMRLNKGNIFSA